MRALRHAAAAVVAVCTLVLLAALAASPGGAAASSPRLQRATVTKTVTATVTATQTVTATATVTVPGPTTTVTVTGSPTSSAPTSTSATPTPTPTATSSAPSGGNCTNPVWNSGGLAQATYKVDDYWWINNDAWSGGHGPQTIYVCNQSSWYAVSNQPDNGGAVETYPDTEFDPGGRSTPSTKTVAQYNTISSTFAEEFPAAGSWDASYDIWMTTGAEIMIWNEWTGSQTYWPSDKSITVNVGGVPYWFQSLGDEFIFFRQNQVKSGSVDILSALQYLAAHGYIQSSNVIDNIEYGVEICSTVGTETFPLTGLTISAS